MNRSVDIVHDCIDGGVNADDAGKAFLYKFLTPKPSLHHSTVTTIHNN